MSEDRDSSKQEDINQLFQVEGEWEVDDNGSRTRWIQPISQIELIEEPSNGLPACWDFYEKINSLYRYFLLTRQAMAIHLNYRPKEIEAHAVEAVELLGDEWAGLSMEKEVAALESDDPLFPGFMAISIIAQLFGILETFLQDVAEDVASTLGTPVTFPEKQLPYVEKYLTYIQTAIGSTIPKDRERQRAIEAARAIRNQYLHKLSRELPENIQRNIEKIVQASGETHDRTNTIITDEAFSAIASLAQEIEVLYEDFHKKQSQ